MSYFHVYEEETVSGNLYGPVLYIVWRLSRLILKGPVFHKDKLLELLKSKVAATKCIVRILLVLYSPIWHIVGRELSKPSAFESPSCSKYSDKITWSWRYSSYWRLTMVSFSIVVNCHLKFRTIFLCFFYIYI